MPTCSPIGPFRAVRLDRRSTARRHNLGSGSCRNQTSKRSSKRVISKDSSPRLIAWQPKGRGTISSPCGTVAPKQLTAGKQLWGIAQFVEYRLALDAPGEYAGRVIKEGAGRYALGPLWEVAASGHTWVELSPHIDDGRVRAFAAHERSIRGEGIPDTDIDLQVVDVPLVVAAWEPDYPVAEYRPDQAAFPERELPEMVWQDLGDPGAPSEGDEAADALLDLARVWIDESKWAR